MRELSLFTGIGGGLLGTHLLGWTPIGYVEINEYCQRVIAQRIKDGILPVAPIFTDVREFVQSGAADCYRGHTDVVSGGFPCQPFSVAGKRKGADDERNMWPATLEVIRRVQPTWAFLENVPGLLSSGYFGTILNDLSESGFDVGWRILSAAEVGAPHLRKRLWIVAHAPGIRRSEGQRHGDRPRSTGTQASTGGMQQSGRVGGLGKTRNLPDPSSQQNRRLQQRGISPDAGASSEVSDAKGVGSQAAPITSRFHTEHACTGNAPDYTTRGGYWQAEPRLGRLVNGVPDLVERLRADGNGQVPQVAATAWRLLTE